MHSADDGVITLYNRATGQLEEEKVMGRALVDFCYGNPLGRLITEAALKRKGLSKLLGLPNHLTPSAKKIPQFIAQYGINTDEIRDPLDSFRTFNDFFTRKLKPGARPVAADPEILISPADSRLMAYPVADDTVIPIKGCRFKLPELVPDAGIARAFTGGICLVFRLAPVDYHRFCYIDEGSHGPIVKVAGALHSVNPISLRQGCPALHGNYREIAVLKTRNFGEVAHIDVGAMVVGKIVQHLPQGGSFARGQEKGYFEFGASTIIVLLTQGAATLDADIEEYSSRNIETIVRYGSAIGKAG